MATKTRSKTEPTKQTRPSKKNDTGYVYESTGETKFSEDNLKNAFKDYSYDPFELTSQILNFGMELIGVPLYEYQEQFAYRVVFAVITFENETITALWSRQSGKSETMAFIADTLMVILPVLANIQTGDFDSKGKPIYQFPEFTTFRNGFKIGLYAPQQLQVDTTYERAFERIGSENAEQILSHPQFNVGLSSTKVLALTNGSVLTGQVASKVSKIESKTYHLIILEENQEMDDYVVQKSIEPMVTATGGTIIKVGTTGSFKNSFFTDINYNKKRSGKIKDRRLIYHFEFDYIQVIHYKRKQFEIDGVKAHLFYEIDVMKKKQKWGADSDAFKKGFSLIWPLESGMFITDGDFNKMVNKRIGFINTRIPKDWVIVAGVDFGKDHDSTVITIGRTYYEDDSYTTEPPIKQVLAWFEMKGENYDTQHHVIIDVFTQFGVQIAACDYTGVGKGPVDRLIAACSDYIIIIPYTFSTPSKSEMYVSLLGDIRNGRFIAPGTKSVANTPEYKSFETQMKGLYKFYKNGYMVCQHGDEPGDRDDYCDSAGLMSWAGNYDLPDEIEEDPNPFFNLGRNAYSTVKNSGWF